MTFGGSTISLGWADCGDALQDGVAGNKPRVSGQLARVRAGAAIPPVTLPGITDVVRSSAARIRLESSGHSGFRLQTIAKVRALNGMGRVGA
jgi:hypothetical protein